MSISQELRSGFLPRSTAMPIHKHEANLKGIDWTGPKFFVSLNKPLVNTRSTAKNQPGYPT